MFNNNTIALVVALAMQLVASYSFFKGDSEDLFQHNFTMGECQSGDSVLNETNIKRDSFFLGWVSYSYHFPQPDSNTTYNISMIRVDNLIPGDDGGYAMLTEGGLGSGCATVDLVSIWNQGFDFNITVCGTVVSSNDTFTSNSKSCKKV